MNISVQPGGAHIETYTEEIRQRFIEAVEAYERQLEQELHKLTEKTWLALTARKPPGAGL